MNKPSKSIVAAAGLILALSVACGWAQVPASSFNRFRGALKPQLKSPASTGESAQTEKYEYRPRSCDLPPIVWFWTAVERCQLEHRPVRPNKAKFKPFWAIIVQKSLKP